MCNLHLKIRWHGSNISLHCVPSILNRAMHFQKCSFPVAMTPPFSKNFLYCHCFLECEIITKICQPQLIQTTRFLFFLLQFAYLHGSRQILAHQIFLKTAWWLGLARSTVGSFASRLYVENRWSWCPNSKANNFTASFLKHWNFSTFGSLGGWLALFCPAVRRAQALVLRRASRYCLVVLGIS